LQNLVVMPEEQFLVLKHEMGFRVRGQHGLRLLQGRPVFHDRVAKDNPVELLREALPGIAGLREGRTRW
jgi:hypothetical protein